MKIAGMVRQVEQLQTWLEFLTYQMCTMGHEEANLKVHLTCNAMRLPFRRLITAVVLW